MNIDQSNSRIFLITLSTTIFLTYICTNSTAQLTRRQPTSPNQSNRAQNTRKVNVDLTEPWTTTGVQIVVGQQLNISTSGTLNWYTGACNGQCISTPDGIKCTVKPSDGFLTPQFACWSLIAVIGDGKPFQVGSSYNGVAESSGELLLGVNDNNYRDNSGNWEANIQIPEPKRPKILLGDLIVYWKGEDAIHVGLVEAVNSENSITIRSKWGAGAVYDHDPDFNPYVCDNQYDKWVIYRRIINYPVQDIDTTNKLHNATDCYFKKDCVTDTKNRNIILGWTDHGSGRHTEEVISSLCGNKGLANRVEKYYSFSKKLTQAQINSILSNYDCRGFVFDNGESKIIDLTKGLFINCNMTTHHQVQWILDDGYNIVTDSYEFNNRK